MKKPLIIRVFGYAFWFCAGLVLMSHFMRGKGELTSEEMAGVGVFVLVMGPCLLVWVVGSIAYRITASNYKMQADRMAELLRTATQQQMACAYPGPDGMLCDLPAGHQGPHRGVKPGPRAVQTSPLGLTGTDKQ